MYKSIQKIFVQTKRSNNYYFNFIFYLEIHCKTYTEKKEKLIVDLSKVHV